MRITLLAIVLLSFQFARSQNPATIFTIPNKNIVLPCGVTCTSITATVPHIKQTDDYLVTSMQYLPFAYTTTTGTAQTDIYEDDTWSPKIPITFPFCFYGITYPTLLMGSNSNITFDTVRAGQGSGYVITTGTPIPNTAYAPASIFGPYHDINPDPFNNPGGNRKIEWRVEGTAPARRFIASYNQVAYYGSSCNTNTATHQMVLYESTGVIEVYIKDKPVCTGWNSGLAILGVQNQLRNKAVAAPGKNATTWGTVGMNEAYRFTPNGGTPSFKKAELIVDGNVVALADTASGAPGALELSFSNVCPTQDSTAYIMKLTYGICNNSSQDVSYYDTVYVKRTTPVISLSTQDASCAAGGVITVNVAGGTGFQYSLNGAAMQSGNTFSNLTSGNYTILVQSGSCAASAQATIALNNTLTVNALPGDTAICAGGSFSPTMSFSSPNAQFTWTPSQGAGSPLPPGTPVTLNVGNQNTQFIVTATEGQCVAKDTINVTVFTGATANAGSDQTIIAGDQIQLQASGSQGTYLWTPSAGLSATNVLNPVASPQQTTTYTLQVTSTQGCLATDQVTVTVVPYCVKPMEAFTPNGDGINDRWLVTNGGCVREIKAEVFNRYGNRVFQDYAYDNNWDGTYKGKPLPDGTYYFVITYRLINNKLVYQKGNVTILR